MLLDFKKIDGHKVLAYSLLAEVLTVLASTRLMTHEVLLSLYLQVLIIMSIVIQSERENNICW